MNSIASRVSTRRRVEAVWQPIQNQSPSTWEKDTAQSIRETWGTPACRAKLRHASPQTIRMLWSWVNAKQQQQQR